jgi:Predicted nucleic acid-binding protein, contains PIN domain
MTLVDTCVLLDLFTADPAWLSWSQGQLEEYAPRGLGLSDVSFAELAPAFPSPEEAARVLGSMGVAVLRVSPAALYLAGRSFQLYRQNGGPATMVLPDFLIGAQAQTEGLPLITRDIKRYRSYFPSVQLIAPFDSPQP